MEEKMDTFSNPRGWLFKKTEFYSFIIINLLLYYFLLFSPDICSALKVYKEVTISLPPLPCYSVALSGIKGCKLFVCVLCLAKLNDLKIDEFI